MNPQHFKIQVTRLLNTFGKAAYPDERVNLMWRELSGLPDESWTRMVDTLIADHRFAPLMPEIRDLAAIEREKAWAIEKAQHRRESEAAIKNIFDDEMIRSICKTIQDRLRGDVPDETYKNFTNGLKKLTGASCKHCEGSGLVFQMQGNHEFVFRCVCNEGAKQPKTYPSLFAHYRGANP